MNSSRYYSSTAVAMPRTRESVSDCIRGFHAVLYKGRAVGDYRPDNTQAKLYGANSKRSSVPLVNGTLYTVYVSGTARDTKVM